MAKFILLITLCIWIPNNVKAQSMDTILIENTAIAVFNSFKKESFNDFSKLLLEKTDYLELVQQISEIDGIKNKEFEQSFDNLSSEIETAFSTIIKKGTSKGIDWNKVEFDGFIFTSEELIVGIATKSKGFLIDGNIRIKYTDRDFSIIGIQLMLFDNQYKLKGDELRGLFEIDLNTYIPPDDMYLDEMEEEGY